MTKTVTVLSGLIRPLVEGRLPGWVEPRFFQSKEEAMSLAPEAEIGWFDMHAKEDMVEAITRAGQLKWLNSIIAGRARVRTLLTLASARAIERICGPSV